MSEKIIHISDHKALRESERKFAIKAQKKISAIMEEIENDIAAEVALELIESNSKKTTKKILKKTK